MTDGDEHPRSWARATRALLIAGDPLVAATGTEVLASGGTVVEAGVHMVRAGNRSLSEDQIATAALIRREDRIKSTTQSISWSHHTAQITPSIGGPPLQVLAADGLGQLFMFAAGAEACSVLVKRSGVPVVAAICSGPARARAILEPLCDALAQGESLTDLLTTVRAPEGLSAIWFTDTSFLTGWHIGLNQSWIHALSGGPARMPEGVNFFDSPI